jgi:ParB family transcriptional regulator, chromosome partitioning protein
MNAVCSVSPFRCCLWELHDRLESDITEATCQAEIESFSRHGQLIPALGRPLRGDPLHDVELICGARRLFAARYLNRPLLVELRELSDREAIVAMDIENRQRKDMSPYERGLGFDRWLRAGCFQSQEDIARALSLSPAQVSRLLKLARLPEAVVNSFESPLDLRERWGLDLADRCEDPRRRQALVRQAEFIRTLAPRPAAPEIYQQLVDSSDGAQSEPGAKLEEIVLGRAGRALFRLRRQSRSITLLLPNDTVSGQSLEQIRDAVADILMDPAMRPQGLHVVRDANT